MTWESFPDDSLACCGCPGDIRRGVISDSDHQGPLPHWPEWSPSSISARRPRQQGIGGRLFPLNDAEAGNISARRTPARENRAWMSVRRIVPAQLSLGSSFIAMLGQGPTLIEVGTGETDQWSSTFSNCTARAALSSHLPSSLWRRARLSGRSAIELLHEFLTTIFGVVVIVANVRRLSDGATPSSFRYPPVRSTSNCRRR